MGVFMLADFVLSPTPEVLSVPSASPAMVAQDLDWDALVVEPLQRFFLGVLSYLPDILTALCILLTGWIIGRILQFVVTTFLRQINFDKFAAKIGVAKVLEEGGEKVVPHRWFGALTFWVVIFISFIISLDQLRMRPASAELDHFLRFVFTVLTGLVITVFGMILSFVCARVVRACALNINARQPDLYASLAQGIVLAFTLLAALMQIGLSSVVILVGVGAITVTLCITFIIAFGFGGVTWAGKVLDKTLKENKKSE
jgi:hypothetical protein